MEEKPHIAFIEMFDSLGYESNETDQINSTIQDPNSETTNLMSTNGTLCPSSHISDCKNFSNLTYNYLGLTL